MTVPPSIDPARMLEEQLAQASPDLLRELLQTFVNTLLSAEADAVCGAGYGERNPERVNQRNGYRHRDFDTRGRHARSRPRTARRTGERLMNPLCWRTCGWRRGVIAGFLLVWIASPAAAQNYSFDARRIALGGAGGTPNVASKLVERQRRYRSILIPVGLVKVLTDVRVFYPNREDFDFSRAVEYGTSPLHFVFGRSDDITAGSFFRDMINARLQSDLNAYRGDGFDTPLITSAEGLVSLTWGYTFMLHQSDRSFQGIYVGAGPYLASQAYADFDSEFEKLLNSSTDTYVRSASMGESAGISFALLKR